MALKRISMAGADVVVTEAGLADLVQEYAMELGRAGTTDIVSVPDVREGHATETRLLLGPASQIAVTENEDESLAPVSPGLVEEATAHVAERWPHLGLWNASFTAALSRLEAKPA